MEEVFSFERFQEQVANSELGEKWLNDPLMNQDVWPLTQLGYSAEECQMRGGWNIYYVSFKLLWLKLLAKLTTKAGIRQKQSISSVEKRVFCLRQLDDFLRVRKCDRPEHLSNSLLQDFISEKDSKNRATVMAYVTNLWREEQWLKLSYTHRLTKKNTPKIEIIPEEVLYQVYENFDLFPPPLERMFRLQLVLGCRIGELLMIPRQCLQKENDKWFLLRWIAKYKYWKSYQISPLVAELIQEQQKFLTTQFGDDSDFDKLFCRVSSATRSSTVKGIGKRFEKRTIYSPEVMTTSIVSGWLQNFVQKADLKDKFGQTFDLQTHMFRRTKASIMKHCETEDEYIAVILGHRSLDMIPHYGKPSLERLEKEAKAKGYVDMYGQITAFKPRATRYAKLANLLKISTPLGECHRPLMLGDCQYRYACLNCGHHRVTLEDQPKLEADYQRLKLDLYQAENLGEKRRVVEINRLLELINTRLQGLKELENIQRGQESE